MSPFTNSARQGEREVQLRTNVALKLSGVMIVSGIIAFAIAYASITSNAKHVDQVNAETNAARTLHAFELKLDALYRIAGDWAMWDETYVFVTAVDEAYISNNLAPESLSNLDLSVLAFYGTENTLVHSVSIDPETGEEITLAGLEDLTRTYGDALNVRDAGGVGVVPLSDGHALLVAARPVLRSDQSGPPAGTLIVGRVVDESLTKAIADAAGVVLTVGEASTGGPAPGTTRVEWTDDDTIVATASLADPLGAPALEVRAVSPLIAQQEAHKAINVFAIGLLGLFAVTTAFIVFDLDRSIMRRLSSLSVQVRTIRESGEAARVRLSGSDELATLSHDVDEMVAALDDSRQEVIGARDKLEERVSERTSELQESVLELQREVSQREAAEGALRESDQKHRALVENLVDLLLIVNREGRVTYANRSVFVSLELPTPEPAGMKLADLLTDESTAAVLELIQGNPVPEALTTLELTAITHDGTRIAMDASVLTIDSQTLQVLMRDVTLRRRYEEELLYIAGHDYLTGLFNRRRFEEELGRALAEALRRERHGAVLWLDLDEFKEINDTLGHTLGDQMLITIANALKQGSRDESTLSRLGGDEFAILLPDTDALEARQAAERVLGQLRRASVEVGGRSIHITASVGIVLYPDHGSTVEELLSNADIAMYRAKESGRGRWAMYAPDEAWISTLTNRVTWSQRLQDALTTDRLVAFAQPIHDVATGSWNHLELLVRMQDEDGSVIPPERFLTAAERVGLVSEIDLWMMKVAIRLLEQYTPESLELNCNVSPRSLADGGFLDNVRRLLRGTDVDPARLGIEITETAIVNDMGRVNDAVRAIKHIGCRLILDDFGSGFSSFFYLKQMPIDCLKIDGAYIRNIAHSKQDQHLVRAIVEMARGLDMVTTAEYIEDISTMQLLREIGVDYAQGYALGRPEEASALIERLMKSASSGNEPEPDTGKHLVV